MALRPADVVERMDLVISLGQTELAAQVTQEAGIDTKATGIAGLAGALDIGAVAASSALGPIWWIPGLGFLLATVFALVTLFTDPVKTGPRLAEFYESIKGESAETAKRKAIEDLIADISSNRSLLDLRRVLLQRTMWLFAGTLVVSAIVLLASRRYRYMAVEIRDKRDVTVERLPELQASSRPQEEIEVGIVPLPERVKAWLYRQLGRQPQGKRASTG